MKTSQNEYLSALLDDEAGEFERRRLLNELSDDAELGQTLSRYALVGEVMRTKQHAPVMNGTDFLAGIQQQLDSEPTYAGLEADTMADTDTDAVFKRGRGWRNSAPLRYGIAATVAAAALTGMLLMQGAPEQIPASLDNAGSGTLALMAESTEDTTAGHAVDAQQPTAEIAKEPEVRSRPVRNPDRQVLANTEAGDTLKQYVTLHMQYRTSNGIAPSIQAVSYAK